MTRPFSMLDLLLDADPLSQVVFIHDYVQLVFQEMRLSIYNPISIKIDRILNRNDLGFHDKLIGLIGGRVKDQWDDESLLYLEFDSTACVVISLRALGNY